jgi:threonine synthase
MAAVSPSLDLVGAEVRAGESPEMRFFDYLPVDDPQLLDHGSTVATPCRPAARLGAAIGVPHLWVKDESRQPTGSTKDRLASVVLAVFRQLGIDQFVAASTGNSATALARAVERDGRIRAHFFCGRDFATSHHVRRGDRIDLTVVDADYAAATAVAQRFATDHGLVWEGGFFNWARREGLKLAYLEAFDAMDREPSVVVQAVSSGMGMLAAHKGAIEFIETGRLSTMPRLLMAQQDTCAPMATAWHEGRADMTDADIIENPDGLARAILLGDGRVTYPYLHQIATTTGGAIVAVSQDELRTARRQLVDLEGLDVCYASAATLAAVRNEAAAGRISQDEVVLLNLTGRHQDSTEP